MLTKNLQFTPKERAMIKRFLRKMCTQDRYFPLDIFRGSLREKMEKSGLLESTGYHADFDKPFGPMNPAKHWRKVSSKGVDFFTSKNEKPKMMDKEDWNWACFSDTEYKKKKLSNNVLLELIYGKKRGGMINVWLKKSMHIAEVQEGKPTYDDYFQMKKVAYYDWDNALYKFNSIDSANDIDYFFK